PHPLGSAQRSAVERELLRDRVLHERGQLLGRADRVERGAELRDACPLDAALQLRVGVDRAGRPRAARGAVAVAAVVEAARELSERGGGLGRLVVVAARDAVVEAGHRLTPGSRTRRPRPDEGTGPTRAPTSSLSAREKRLRGSRSTAGMPVLMLF